MGASYMTFDEIKAAALTGRTKVGPFGRARSLGNHLKAVYYDRPYERAAIRLYDTDIITEYNDGKIIIDFSWPTQTSRRKIEAYIYGPGFVAATKNGNLYFPGRNWGVGYVFDHTIVLEKVGRRLYPVDKDTMPMIVHYARPRLPIGKRWWFVNDANNNVLIHRCQRKMHAVRLNTTVCSNCKENLVETFPDFKERIAAAASFRKLGGHLNVIP